MKTIILLAVLALSLTAHAEQDPVVTRYRELQNLGVNRQLEGMRKELVSLEAKKQDRPTREAIRTLKQRIEDVKKIDTTGIIVGLPFHDPQINDAGTFYKVSSARIIVEEVINETTAIVGWQAPESSQNPQFVTKRKFRLTETATNNFVIGEAINPPGFFCISGAFENHMFILKPAPQIAALHAETPAPAEAK